MHKEKEIRLIALKLEKVFNTLLQNGNDRYGMETALRCKKSKKRQSEENEKVSYNTNWKLFVELYSWIRQACIAFHLPDSLLLFFFVNDFSLHIFQCLRPFSEWHSRTFFSNITWPFMSNCVTQCLFVWQNKWAVYCSHKQMHQWACRLFFKMNVY